MNTIVQAVVLSLLISSNVMADKVSAYLYANYKNSDTVFNALKANKFEILGEYDVNNDENNHIIVFTNPMLKEPANHPERGFAGVLKVLVSKKDHRLVLNNPEYFNHAFLQDQYDERIANSITHLLSNAFGHLSYSDAGLDEEDIEEYHFIMGMPYYEDMIIVAKGNNLLEKLEKSAEDKIIFTLELTNSTLVGIDMLSALGDKEFISKIKGERHGAFLPYMILIENNKAKILHPKYYIAISYPELTMTEFVNISSAPEDIKKYITGLFK